MEADFWHERWSRGEIGFHQHDFNQQMKAFVGGLGLPQGGHVLVPLCGKSLDMLWLLQEGYRVTGIELSRKAVTDFFLENGIKPQVKQHENHETFSHGALQIICGDFFDAGSFACDTFDAVYDRASLIALPPIMRPDYVQILLTLVPPGRRILLITLDYPQAEMSGPPFSVSADEVWALFGSQCTIAPLHNEDCLENEPRFRKKGLSRLHEHVYMLQTAQKKPA